ncbi:DUF6882 domain-containing protein [Paenibacillus roseipurpureus]|uniref:Uncharacterized protein n=1 Tax=Paenibacillus roseopurpureus TaxID=2918901 RepID=A0AA96LQL8_9BACL|nr:DUF6882 domain-containing protein [Paenibacillus sp. MBLB1832]WNR45374.1 hypothetical protein MJB10_04345 [Paenibacillus sp. MBLB1832]
MDSSINTKKRQPAYWLPKMLGSVSHQSHTWLWAWANSQAQISSNSLTQAIKLKAYGIKNNIPELTKEKISATNNEGHVIASIASGMFKNRFYYAGNYGAGTAFFTIDVAEDLMEQPESVLTVTKRFLTFRFEKHPFHYLCHSLNCSDWLLLSANPVWNKN